MEAKKISPQLLSPCISCGYCLSACPTYQITKDERSSPRGRISLMKEFNSGSIEVTNELFVEQSSFCLGCRACEPVCPAGVQYGALLEEWREITWTGKNLPLRIRGLRIAVTMTPIIRLLGRLRRVKRNTQKNADQRSDFLMLGCVERVLYPQLSRVIAKRFPSIVINDDQGCCGALHSHNGAPNKGHEMALSLGQDLPGRIVTTAGGCAAHLSTEIGREKVIEFSEFVLEKILAGELTIESPIYIDGKIARIGLQDSCHLRNGMAVFQEPRQILAKLGTFIDMKSSKDCCGAAGTYAIMRPDDSTAVLSKKLVEIEAADLDFLVTLNPGCQRQLEHAPDLRKSKVRVLHLVELLELSLSTQTLEGSRQIR